MCLLTLVMYTLSLYEMWKNYFKTKQFFENEV